MCSRRTGGRTPEDLRPITVTYNVLVHAAASVLFELGKTKVLCAVTLQNGVPHFLKGSGKGWLTAEYAMLPAATAIRTQRATSSFKPNGRSVEISRFIGRSLRAVVDLDLIGERTIIVDCDVLTADGSTRTASITGAGIALRHAVARWMQEGRLQETIIRDDVAAVSVGCADGDALLDVNFAEDSTLDADFNFVFTRSGDIIEIQGAAETYAISWQAFQDMCALVRSNIDQLFAACDEYPLPEVQARDAKQKKKDGKKIALFSLQNRVTKQV